MQQNILPKEHTPKTKHLEYPLQYIPEVYTWTSSYE